jgi:hypothetical protein
MNSLRDTFVGERERGRGSLMLGAMKNLLVNRPFESFDSWTVVDGLRQELVEVTGFG